jgi:chaperonin GroES
LLLQASIIGTGFKKVYMGPSACGATSCPPPASRSTTTPASIHTCPRITHEFPVYPYEIEDRIRAGIYRDITLAQGRRGPGAPRKFIEQHRLDDLDGDGLAEPYIVTVDVDTQQVMRVEPAYTADDITVDSQTGRSCASTAGCRSRPSPSCPIPGAVLRHRAWGCWIPSPTAWTPA